MEVEVWWRCRGGGRGVVEVEGWRCKDVEVRWRWRWRGGGVGVEVEVWRCRGGGVEV